MKKEMTTGSFSVARHANPFALLISVKKKKKRSHSLIDKFPSNEAITETHPLDTEQK